MYYQDFDLIKGNTLMSKLLLQVKKWSLSCSGARVSALLEKSIDNRIDYEHVTGMLQSAQNAEKRVVVGF